VDRAELLTLMDLNWCEMTRAIARTTPGGWIVERCGLVMCGTPLGTMVTNMTMVAGRVDARTLREESDHVFRERSIPFSLWTRAHADGELERALPATGFSEVWKTPAMTLDPAAAARLTSAHGRADVRVVEDDTDRAAYADVMADAYAIYGAPHEATRAHFAMLASVAGPTTQAFLAWHDGRPVAGAALYVSHGVGGIGWVGTLPAYARCGYAAAVTGAAVRAGGALGVRFFNLQASPMGVRLYERMGFTTPTYYRVFVS